MRLVIALGGNALLKRGEPMLCENQRENVSLACRQIANLKTVESTLSQIRRRRARGTSGLWPSSP